MKNHFLSVILLLISIDLNAQTTNYREHVAPIIYDNCSGCHHSGGIAAFSLMSCSDASTYAGFIGLRDSSNYAV
jgi:hypothetical protein